MKKLLISSIAALGLIGTPAFAADMAVKAPPPAPPPAPTWTGFYVGGNIGASFGNVKTDFNVTPTGTTGGGQFPPIILDSPGFAFSNTEIPSGFTGGGQIGYNWQYSPLIVVGLEADFQGALERDSNNLSNSFFGFIRIPPGGIIPNTEGTADTNYSTQIDWFGTVRGRIGYVWGNGQVLSYVTRGAGLRRGQDKRNEHSQHLCHREWVSSGRLC